MSKSITFDRPTKAATPESWVLAKAMPTGEPTKRLTALRQTASDSRAGRDTTTEGNNS